MTVPEFVEPVDHTQDKTDEIAEFDAGVQSKDPSYLDMKFEEQKQKPVELTPDEERTAGFRYSKDDEGRSYIETGGQNIRPL